MQHYWTILLCVQICFMHIVMPFNLLSQFIKKYTELVKWLIQTTDIQQGCILIF